MRIDQSRQLVPVNKRGNVVASVSPQAHLVPRADPGHVNVHHSSSDNPTFLEHQVLREDFSYRWFIAPLTRFQVAVGAYLSALRGHLRCLVGTCARHLTERNAVAAVTMLIPVLQSLLEDPQTLSRIAGIQSYFCSSASPLSHIAGIQSYFCPSASPLALAAHEQVTPLRSNFTNLVQIQDIMDALATDKCEGGWDNMIDWLREVQFGAVKMVHGVKYSDLECSEDLSYDLRQLNATADEVVESVQDWQAKACSTTSKLNAIDGHSLRLISQIKPRRSFWYLWLSGDEVAPDALVKSFTLALKETSDLLELLIKRLTVIQSNLKKMEADIDNIRDITYRESHQITGSRDEILYNLWTYLGFNRAQIDMYERGLWILGNVTHYTETSLKVIGLTRDGLTNVRGDLTQLHSETSKSPMTGVDKATLQIEMQSIREGRGRWEKKLNSVGTTFRRLEGTA